MSKKAGPPQYSCAYWDEGVETLAEAQEAKLAHIAAKLALAPGQEEGIAWMVR
ncbi:MAG: hypothetical protein CL820_12355 [Croceicoccus sp.]|nr:hypothetical protein [Croceicoccus sp.]MAL26656.1 hypothetical protein [Croceicoccus sp.]